jgi:hypothetical protein
MTSVKALAIIALLGVVFKYGPTDWKEDLALARSRVQCGDADGLMKLRLPPGVVVANGTIAEMTPLGLEAWPLRLATIVVRHDQPLFDYSPVAQELEPALSLMAVVSIGGQSQQRRTVSSQFSMVTIAVAR